MRLNLRYSQTIPCTVVTPHGWTILLALCCLVLLPCRWVSAKDWPQWGGDIHFQRLFIDKPLLPNGAPGQWNSSESGHPGMFEDADGQLYMFYQGNNDHGRTWFLSWVRIGWDGHKPRVIEPHKVNGP